MTERLIWLDMAKGVGIVSVVAYHTLKGLLNSSSDLPFWVEVSANYLSLWLMPMFFIVSGILSKNTILNASTYKIRKKIINWIYLYLIWSFIIYSVRLTFNNITNTHMEMSEILYIIWDPVPTIWFIYALLLSFILTRLIKSINANIILFIGLVTNIINGYYHGWFPGSIFERFAWIYVFYALGYYYSEYLKLILTSIWFNRISLLLLITITTYLVIIEVNIPKYLEPFVATFISLLFLSLCKQLSEVKFLSLLNKYIAYLGFISLFVYLVHFPIPAATRVFLFKLNLNHPIGVIILAVFLSVTMGVIAEKFSKTRLGHYFFSVGRSQSKG